MRLKRPASMRRCSTTSSMLRSALARSPRTTLSPQTRRSGAKTLSFERVLLRRKLIASCSGHEHCSACEHRGLADVVADYDRPTACAHGLDETHRAQHGADTLNLENGDEAPGHIVVTFEVGLRPQALDG